MRIWQSKETPWHWIAARAGRFDCMWQCAIHGWRIQYIHTPLCYWRKHNCGLHFGLAFLKWHAGLELHW